jgi:hypothetical protein
MKVFIGSEPSQERPERALVKSIRQTSPGADIVVMRAGDAGWTGFPKTATGFTLFRWCIPELMGFQGFAIYLDSDMLVLRDISELYDYRQPGRWVQHNSTQGDCVSVIDCSAMPQDWPSIDEIKRSNKNILRAKLEAIIDRSIPDDWNCCDRYDPNAGLIHFTSIATQPWTAGGVNHPDPKAVELWHEY